ncbi:MAG: diaminopimelate epimerase [Gemmataceae bacterium]
MRFTKMQGIGNDYVYVDCFAGPTPRDPAALARKISDRHFGVGSDGLILIAPSECADARMRMFNADGSEGEMCGNGVRCVAKYVHDHGIARRSQLRIETGRGVLTLDLDIVGGKADRIRVDMGEPILQSSDIPTTLPGNPPVDAPLVVLGQPLAITCVSMGNPHAVAFLDNLDCGPDGRSAAEYFGPTLERHSAFPRRVNAHFVRVDSSNEVTMRTWERGSGITLACGTGACAVCVAGVLTGRSGRRLLAHLPGGDLDLLWSESDNHVYMTGPAVEVFSGEWPAD